MMFLPGSAGLDKTTAVKLSERFCFEFCREVIILWNNRTFPFTAYTGSADQEEMYERKDVRMLVIDEISFMKKSDMANLDVR